MNIYDRAEQFGYGADYYDMDTGYIYGIQEYGRAKKFGLPTPAEILFNEDGIIIYDHHGQPVGIAKKELRED